jgi:hypothetical protein
MPTAPEQVRFMPDEPGELTALMEAMVERGKGWINTWPDVDDDALPQRKSFFSIFSGMGPAVPLCTWVAPQPDQKPPHIELGIQHASGPKAKKRLEELGHPVPDRWVVLADHPKRGLVIAVHPEATVASTLEWLVTAGKALARVPIPERWRATVHKA